MRGAVRLRATNSAAFGDDGRAWEWSAGYGRATAGEDW
jgi:hypothetical protein